MGDGLKRARAATRGLPAKEVGKKFRWTNGKTGRVVEGIVDDVRWSGSTILDTRTKERWPGVQFRIKPEKGRAVWTTAFPLKEAEA